MNRIEFTRQLTSKIFATGCGHNISTTPRDKIDNAVYAAQKIIAAIEIQNGELLQETFINCCLEQMRKDAWAMSKQQIGYTIQIAARDASDFVLALLESTGPSEAELDAIENEEL